MTTSCPLADTLGFTGNEPTLTNSQNLVAWTETPLPCRVLVGNGPTTSNPPWRSARNFQSRPDSCFPATSHLATGPTWVAWLAVWGKAVHGPLLSSWVFPIFGLLGLHRVPEGHGPTQNAKICLGVTLRTLAADSPPGFLRAQKNKATESG